ncbi:TetR/AcrR family transcriptional regulator [Bacillus sp. OK048]|uniref:TetR/AcrR family transcriptional regulator n=1 Tax=Bacillus sp. OK048 TaxID=1882761 RepID=UPI00088DDE4C|nr:TetR/AcrR family transcriptional regulator [Bacillus sp. OK048]SDM40384.1 transcriptional regulator, TetR family [Bacillus sp. OK048]
MTDTSDRLLYAAINLISEKGYKAVSTKEIAKEASVSEMTLFRHFGTKQGMLEAAIDRFYYSASMKEIFDKNIVWDLEKDLLMISESYLRSMQKNKKVIHIAFKEGNSIEGLFNQINKHPRQLKELLINYFLEMKELGKIRFVGNLESLAMSYLYMVYGEFVSRNFVEGHEITSIDENEFINTTVQLFVSALKK